MHSISLIIRLSITCKKVMIDVACLLLTYFNICCEKNVASINIPVNEMVIKLYGSLITL